MRIGSIYRLKNLSSPLPQAVVWGVLVAVITAASVVVWLVSNGRDRVLEQLRGPFSFPDIMVLASWVLGVIIVIWTVLGATRAKKALENTERLLNVTLERYPDFSAHVQQMCEHVGKGSVGCPAEVTLVLSTLAYGIQSRREQGSAKGYPDPAEEAFGELLNSWLVAWETQARSDHPGTFILRLCVWEPGRHRQQFGYGAGGNKAQDYDARLANYLNSSLLPFLNGIRKLSESQKLSVRFSTTTCDEVRIALVKGSHRDGGYGYDYRSIFLAITLLRAGPDGNKDEVSTGNVKYLGFTSKEESAFGQVKAFADECFHSAESQEGVVEPHRDPERFIEHYFGTPAGAAVGGRP